MEQENEKKDLCVGQCSYYENNRAKRNTPMTLERFVAAIRSDHWKRQVEDYRRLTAEGTDPVRARAIKDGMPGLVVAGVCEGGHAKCNFRRMSGYLMVDIDDCEGDVRELLRRLCAEPWVQAGWVSISGKGLKLAVRVDALTQHEYEKEAYPAVAERVAHLAGCPVDLSCRDLSRTCYASYDPEAYWRAEACELYPWREEAARRAKEERPAENPPAAANVAPSAATPTAVRGMVYRFLQNFIERHPYVPRHRHDFLLALGREAYRFGMDQNELNSLVILAESNLAMPDCDVYEIRRNILDAYKFGEQKGLGGQPSGGFMVRKVQYVPKNLHTEDGEEDEERSVSDINHELRMEAPCLPDGVFSRLPEFLRQGLAVAQNPRQRDMLFLAMMANLSACMPGVRMVYDDADIYPHCFVAVVASSASGKGIMAAAARLGEGIQKMLNVAYEEALNENEKAQLLWEQECRRAVKERRKPDLKFRPEPVVRRTLMVPADVSRTQLIRLMSGSPDGVLMNVSEMDTLRSAVNADYGRFDDLMRACFHHEMFGSDFKQDKRPCMVWCPKMAFCASGTPGQFYHLCPSVENGAYSRYLIYMAEQEADFRHMAPRGEAFNKIRLFRKLSERTLEMYRFLRAHPTEVKFTPEQWNEHQTFFDRILDDVKLEEAEAPVAVVFRHGMNAARLAMVLTALRKFEGGWEFYEMNCTEEDFRIALDVTAVLLRHSLTLSTSLRKESKDIGEMRHYFLVRNALEKLKSEFRYRELINALVSEGMSTSSAKRIRNHLLAKKVIVKEGDMYRFVHHRWRNRL